MHADFFLFKSVRGSVSNPVNTDTGIPVFGTPNTDTDTAKISRYLPVLKNV
jgi:hypothetical protein